MPKRQKTGRINNLIVVSDLHCGCRVGLCPADPVPLDDGGEYTPSKLQKIVWGWWIEFWQEWVPDVCHGEPCAVLINGDALDGVHHKATTQVSHNLGDQAEICRRVVRPAIDACEGRLYWIRGTEAHSGASGVDEERLARDLRAIPDADGRHARYEAWVELGNGLVHALHHIGTSGTMHYESTAVLKELAEAYAEAGRWHERPPDVIVRSHRHRHLEVRVPTDLGYGIAFCTPGWQLRTPFAYRIAGARQAAPQIGGSLIRQGDADLFTRHRVWTMARTESVKL